MDPGSLGVGDTRTPGVVWDALLRKSIGAMAFFYCCCYSDALIAYLSLAWGGGAGGGHGKCFFLSLRLHILLIGRAIADRSLGRRCGEKCFSAVGGL